MEDLGGDNYIRSQWAQHDTQSSGSVKTASASIYIVPLLTLPDAPQLDAVNVVSL